MKTLYTIVALFLAHFVSGQSIEIMPGHENLFFDVQFLKPLKPNDYTFTAFSRTRGIVGYEGGANILSAAYVNYTSKIGLGTTVIGAVNSASGPTSAAGINILKVRKSFSVFALGAVEFGRDLGYSFFTIMRYTPKVNEKWKWYTSLELFTLYRNTGHAVSSERARIGMDYQGLQFGVGANLTQFGASFNSIENIGLFIRKTFK